MHRLLRWIAPAALHFNVGQSLAVVGMAVRQQAVVKIGGRQPQPFRMAQHGVARRRVQQNPFPARTLQHDGGMIPQGTPAGPRTQVADFEPRLSQLGLRQNSRLLAVNIDLGRVDKSDMDEIGSTSARFRLAPE